MIPDKYPAYRQTDSPWTYHELLTMSLIPIHTPERKMDQRAVNEASQVQIAHTVTLKYLTDLSDIEFENWTEKLQNAHIENALDVLCNLKPAKVRRSNLYGWKGVLQFSLSE